MKLGDGGEAFFVFETTGFVPAEMQTSPLVSPSASPKQLPTISDPASLQEPEYLNIADGEAGASKDSLLNSITIGTPRRVQSDYGRSNNPSLFITCLTEDAMKEEVVTRHYPFLQQNHT